jgi:hypothetical protein
MTRIGSSATPIGAAELPAEREPATAGGPFRAALRAARKPDRSDEAAGVPALAAQAQAAERAAAERASEQRPRDDQAPTASPRGRSTKPIQFSARAPARITEARADEAAPQAPDVPAGAPSSVPGGAINASAMPSSAAPTGRAAAPTGNAGPTAATGNDSPVAAWLAAAVGRAFGAFNGDGEAGSPGAAAAALAPSPPSLQAQLTGGGALAALSPLEQAVHDLLDQLADDAPEGSDPGAHGADLAALHALGAAAPAASDGPDPAIAPVRAALPSPPPELPGQPSHLHLVLDDGPERVVMTVAMRGSDVHVALRASDDATSAALARNAASLDHAMRARGLALGELITERDPRDRRQSPDRQPGEPQPDAEPFALEETP